MLVYILSQYDYEAHDHVNCPSDWVLDLIQIDTLTPIIIICEN